MKINSLVVSSLVTFGLFLSACSGGGSSSDSSSAPQDVTAYFIDSPVAGLHYKSQSKEGSTAIDGGFKYSPSDKNVTFKVGDITLGTIAVADINADSKVFTQDLVGVSRDTIENEELLKVASLLQSLDTRANPSGITLDENDLEKLTETKNINDVNLTRQLSFADKTPVDIDEVKEHLGHTIRTNGIALYNYTPHAVDSNISTLKNIVTNSILNAVDRNDKFLSFTLESDTSHGTVEFIDDTNSFKYTPDTEFVGTDSFTYKAYDGEKYSKVTTVNIAVEDIVPQNINDTTPPTAPAIVSLNAQVNSLSLFWLGSTDDNTAQSDIRYEVHLSTDVNFTADSTTLKQTVINTLEADISGLSDNTLYYVKVKAVDASDNTTLSEEGEMQTLPQEVVLVPTAIVKKATDLHLENAQESANKLLFEDSLKAEVPQAGDILVGNADNAYLKRVVSVDKNDSTTKIIVEDVAITDVIESAKLSSKVVLFGTSQSGVESRSLKRSVRYTTNNTKETTTSWESGRFGVTQKQNLPSSSILKRALTKSNSDFSVTVVQDNITVVQGQTLQIDIEATMTQAGIDDDWKFTSVKLLSLGERGAGLYTTKSNELEAKAYLKWTPNKSHVSTEAYIAEFEVCAEDTFDDGISDIMGSDCETLEASITVIGDGKVDTGGEITTKFDTETEFTNDVTFDFTPTLTIEHEINGKNLDYAKVALKGEIDFNVITKFAYTAAATKKYESKIVNKTYKSVYMAGTVPIYQEVTFTLDAVLLGRAEASITATSNLQTNYTVEVGMEYDGSSWTPIAHDELTKDYTAEIKAAGGVNVYVRLVPNIEIKFYKAMSSGMSVEPWITGDLRASATAQYNTDFADSDTLGLHRVEDLNVKVGIEGKVYADLTIWKANLLHYPSAGGKKTIFNPTLPIFDIPTIELTDNSVDVCSDSAYLINAAITNPTSLIENDFVENEIKWVVFPSAGAAVTPTAGNLKEATFSFDKQDEYKVYMVGNSEKLGSFYGKQYESFTVDTRGCTIEEVDETAPELTSSPTASVNENQTSAITLVATDETSTVTYSISDTTNFNFDAQSGEVTFKTAPDYETKSSYTFTATAKDEANNEATQSVTITILDVDETAADETAPEFTSSPTASVNENQTSAITLAATDETSTVSYSISDITNFNIDAVTGVVTFKTAPDYETQSSYIFTATAKDEADNEATQSVTITILDVDETVDLNNGLVAHYEFENNANDSSGNGNDGTEYGGVTYSDGVIGKAGSFDGVDDYIQIDKNLNLESYTLSVWFKSSDVNPQALVVYGESYDTDKLGYSLFLNEYCTNSTCISSWYETDDDGDIFLATDFNDLDSWHLATVSKNTNGTLNLYIDGLKKEELVNQLAQSEIDHFLTIATRTNSNPNIYQDFFSGQLDDLRIYNRALNASEISELYKLGQSEETVNLASGLVAHYEFEDNANDSSGNSNNGTEYGGVTYVDGVIGKAGSFDGVDDYLDMETIQENITNNAWSYSIWINKNETTTRGTVFNGRNYSSVYPDVNNRKNGFIQFDANGKIVLVSKGSNDDNQLKPNDRSYNSQEWYHITYVYDGDNNHNLYINGTLDGNYTSTTKGDIELFDNISFEIGRHNYDNDIRAFLGGKIDDFRVYSKALNNSEIQELYKLGQPEETVNLASGLVAHYEFEDNANDSSGNSNNGTEYGGVTYVDGVIGKAGSFDGVDDYIEIANNSIFNLHNEITISSWVNLDSPDSLPVISKWKTESGTQGSWIFHASDSNQSFAITGDGTAGRYTASSNTAINSFSHIVGVYNILDNTIRIFVNGIEKGSHLAQSGSIFVSDSKILIGASIYYDSTQYPAKYFNGLIDDLRIYNRALNDSEVQELYSNPTLTTITHNGTTYGTVTSPYTQKVWLDRNLGASQVCTALNDEACYGDYYQWGRNADGHEKSNSSMTSTQANSINPAHGDFINGANDWTTVDSNGSTRESNWNVCPTGFKIATKAELNAETIEEGISNSTDAFNSFLKLPSAGYHSSGGSINNKGSYINVWSTSTDESNSQQLHFDSSDAFWHSGNRATGRSVRCVQN